MIKKTLIFQRFLTFFVLLSFFLLISCSKTVENCKIKPDLERIGESAKENLDNLSETEWRSANLTCNY